VTGHIMTLRENDLNNSYNTAYSRGLQILWQGATIGIADCFAGRMWKNSSKFFLPDCIIGDFSRYIHNLQKVAADRIIKSGSTGRVLKAHCLKASKFKIFKNGAHVYHSSVTLCSFEV
jgi:hypothetical protein